MGCKGVFVTQTCFRDAIHQKRFSFLNKTFISIFTNGANRPGVNRPVRKMVLERIVPGGTGFGANCPVTPGGKCKYNMITDSCCLRHRRSCEPEFDLNDFDWNLPIIHYKQCH